MNIDLIIRHNGQNWLANNEVLNVTAPTLDELDDRLKLILREKNIHKKGSKTTVFMYFDNSTIPQWIRQYAQHYFNRILVVED